MTTQLSGKVIAIAGGTGGLGPSVVKAFADAGAIVALGDRDASKQQHLIAALNLSAAQHTRHTVDLLNPAQAGAWAADIQKQSGRIDGVMHLVGGWRGGTTIAQFPAEDWQLLNEMLIQTTWHVIRAFIEPLKASKGRFVMVSSPQARKPTHTNAAYAAGKAASEALVLAMADELKGTGATANIIPVNAILTPAMLAEKPNDNYSRFTRAEDIAAAMVFLCSDAASAINGQRINLFGSV
jgi:NAD(P)-dependent dehydrogenase (short-subunit alcohol dehydrogenase family)